MPIWEKLLEVKKRGWKGSSSRGGGSSWSWRAQMGKSTKQGQDTRTRGCSHSSHREGLCRGVGLWAMCYLLGWVQCTAMKTQARKELQMKSILQSLVHCFNLLAQRKKMANSKFHHPVTNTWYKKFSGLTSTQDPFSLFLAMITQIQDLYFLRAWPLYSYHLQASSLIHLSDPSQEKRGKVKIKTRIAIDFLTQNLNFSLCYSKTPIPSLDPTSPASYSPISLFPFAPTSSKEGAILPSSNSSPPILLSPLLPLLFQWQSPLRSPVSPTHC